MLNGFCSKVIILRKDGKLHDKKAKKYNFHPSKCHFMLKRSKKPVAIP